MDLGCSLSGSVWYMYGSKKTVESPIVNRPTMKLNFIFTFLLGAAALISQAETKVVAHRGFWNAPGSAQNTCTSFAKADSIGCFGSEIDVWLTADNQLLVNHDRKFQGYEMEFTPTETLRTLRLNNGEQIPTFDEYLACVRRHPGPRLVLEMKSLSDYKREDMEAQMIFDKLQQYGLTDRTDIIVFSLNAAMAFKKLYPSGMKIYYLDGDLSPKKVKKLGLAGIDYSVKVMKKHPEWVKEAHELGLEVNVWTVNTPEDMKYFRELGVDYITTDHPDKALELYGQKKSNSKK